MKPKKQSKYPIYPGSNWDYAVVHSARMALQPPNKNICIYCHAQAVDTKVTHKADCPAKDSKE